MARSTSPAEGRGRAGSGPALLSSLGALALLAACAQPPAPQQAVPEGGWRTFQGTWTASGDRRTLETGGDRQASILDVSGSILLTGARGLGVGFQGRAITFSDGTTGIGRAVWTDERGDQIFSELRGTTVETGRHVHGTFTGGTGRWAGITGEYDFDWTYFIEGEGRAQGRTVGLQGRARLAPEGGAR
jgi:hypothetical protein